MNITDRFAGSDCPKTVELFHQARFVRITHGGLAIWLDPFGMLDPEVVVNLLPQLGVSVDLVRHSHWLGETNEFHKRPSFGVDRSKSARNEESILTRRFHNSGLALVDSGLQLNLEIALSGVSAKVKLSTGFSRRPKMRWNLG